MVIDEVGATLRKFFGSPEAQQKVNKDSLRTILVAIEKHRPRIMELLAEKECVRVVIGADKHVREKRIELAGQILTELE